MVSEAIPMPTAAMDRPEDGGAEEDGPQQEAPEERTEQ